MKRLLLIAALTLTPGLASAQAIQLGVIGMTCEGCASTVKASLEQLPEVKAARIDVKSERAIVTLKDVNAQPTDAELAGAVTKAGYTPGSITR